MRKTLFLSLLCMAMLTACNDDSYEPGKGDLSDLVADLVDLHTKAATQVDYAVTDNNTTLTFNSLMEVQWANKADTIYRGLLYYRKAKNSNNVVPYSLAPVTVLYPVSADKIKEMKTDPVELESGWMAETGRYLNILVKIMTASSGEGDDRQSVGMVLDKVEDNADGHKTYYYTFYHAQNGVPENYSTEVYFSIPTANIAGGDKIVLKVNTRKGVVEKEFVQK